MSTENLESQIEDVYQRSFRQIDPYIDESISKGSFLLDKKSFSLYIVTTIYSGIYNMEKIMSMKMDVIDYITKLRIYIIEQCQPIITNTNEKYIESSIYMAYKIYSAYSSDQLHNSFYLIDFNNCLNICPVVKNNDGKSYIIGVVFYNNHINKYTIMPALEEIPYVNIFNPTAINCYESLNYTGEIDDHHNTTLFDRSNSGTFNRQIKYEIFNHENDLNKFVFNAYTSSMFPKIFSSIIDKLAFENALLATDFDNESNARKTVHDEYYYYDDQIMMNITDFSLESDAIEKNIKQYKEQIRITQYRSFENVTDGFQSKSEAMVYLFNINTKIVSNKYKSQASGFINDILNF